MTKLSAQGRTSRVELNRQAFDEVDLALADGLFAFAKDIIATAKPPDAAPFGEGLVQGGGALAWVGKKKVDGTTIGGRQIAKPRALRLQDGQVTAIAGFGFPARFVELGTIDTHAKPFLTPALAQRMPDAKPVISAAMQRRLAGRRLAAGERDAR